MMYIKDDIIRRTLTTRLCIWLLLTMALCLYPSISTASDYPETKFDVRGRTLTEEKINFRSGNTKYRYTVSEMEEYIRFVRRDYPKESGSLITLMDIYPLLHNPKLYQREEACFRKYFKKNFMKGKKRKQLRKIKEIIYQYLLEDNGRLTMRIIVSDERLIGLYTPQELVDILDKLGRFYFTSPVTRRYKYTCIIQDGSINF